ncbi:MAG: hypothetical protein NWF04_00995 [Candidatus Bathyarchaeota archaeon]|nr:hypothetical protein [Candidatus Bathyarchaeota archaeon]
MIKARRLLKNRTAFSAVIASLILMLLAVASGVVVYAYVMGWIGGVQQNPTNTGVLQVDSAVASTSTVKVYVRNVGGVNLQLDQFYIEGTAVANATTLSPALNVQSTAYLELPYTMTSNLFYEVKVVCTDGTTVSTSVQAQ